MMEAPPGAPLSVRLGAKIGPEVVASILVVAVVIVAVVVALSGRQSPAAVSSPAPSESAAVSSAAASVAVVPSESPVASSPSVSASPSASVSASPARSAAAGPVLQIVDRLLGQRAELQAELAKSGTDAPAIAQLLRDVNASIVAMDEPLIDLAADSSTVDLATRIRAVNTATFDAVRRTQRASIRNERAYRDGAAEVVAKLSPMVELRAELAGLAGETTTPSASAGP